MKVAIYCRLSEEDRNKLHETDDSNSIQNQKAMLLQYTMEQGWELYNIYSDDDYAGADRQRPEFNRLLKDAEKHKFDIVLCKTQSRFTRELELVEKYIHGLFPIWGIRFISIVDNADTANKGNKKSRQINGLVNEWYLEDLSDNIRSVLTNKRQNGYHIGAFAPYGYKKDPDTKGHLIVDEEAAAIVREIFALYLQGRGPRAISQILNNRGIPNPTEYKHLHGEKYKHTYSRTNHKLWAPWSVSYILKNEMYIGNMVQGRSEIISYKTQKTRIRPRSEWYIVEGTHEPIIDRELWDKAQAMAAQRTKAYVTGEIGLFARKARCIKCGHVMRAHRSGGRRYLRCSLRYLSEEACEGSFISVARLEKMVLGELNTLAAEYLNKDELEQKIEFCDSLQQQKKRLLADVTTYKKKAAEYSKGIKDLYLDKVKGLISENDYTEMSRDFVSERDRLERLIANEEDYIADLDDRIAKGDNRKQIIKQYTNLTNLTREIVETLIDYISVGRRIPGTNDVPVEIHWKF